ncbi:hypothetical protein F5148DRAFT_1145920 [Russula earlei]|uniref:Uncharacterized protein n=1 Tax=Russula earlei TaxID=71964 RepID=A0ACC0UNT4_9AGAM|nr:hypothetical protein F5148DRAFT_1145920 [Russula earlei]
MFPSTPQDQSVLELAVECAAVLHERRSYHSNGNYSRFFHLSDFNTSYPDLSVKYTDHVTLEAENLMLQYLYNLACEDGDAAPHVPQPVHYFYHPDTLGYMVMGCIELCIVSDHKLHTKAARAVQWLRTKHPPPGALFGSLGKSYARHTVFPSGMAPQMLRSVAAAEKYLNMAIHLIWRLWNPLTDISLVNEDVVLTQSDMDTSNFGVAPDGRAVLLDTGTIQGLPLTLADFTLLWTTPFATSVSQHVFDADERAARLVLPSLVALADVRRFLGNNSNDCLGVDEDGNRKTQAHF